MFRLTGKALAQFRILSSHTDRAGIQMALAHHDAAFNHKRSSCKAEFVSTQQGTDYNVAASFQLAIHLNTNARTQAVQYQRLLCFCQTEFPRRTGVLDGGLR